VNRPVHPGYHLGFKPAVSQLLHDLQAASGGFLHKKECGSGQKHTDTFGGTLVAPSAVLVGNNPVSITDTSKLDWFGTVRGRLGYLATPNWLVYGTGGLAYGNVNESGSAQPGNPFVGINNAPLVWNQSTTKVGWTAGVGVENALSTNWSWKVEYLYMDLGDVTSNVSGGVGAVGGLVGNCYGSPTSVGTVKRGSGSSMERNFECSTMPTGIDGTTEMCGSSDSFIYFRSWPDGANDVAELQFPCVPPPSCLPFRPRDGPAYKPGVYTPGGLPCHARPKTGRARGEG
jgi:hypothetical protein